MLGGVACDNFSMYVLSLLYIQFCKPPWRLGMRIQRGGEVTLLPLPPIHTASHHRGRNRFTEGWGVTLPIYMEKEGRRDPVYWPQGEQRL